MTLKGSLDCTFFTIRKVPVFFSLPFGGESNMMFISPSLKRRPQTR